ncbi:unnamed protein product [Gadus morhua 'NCC']
MAPLPAREFGEATAGGGSEPGLGEGAVDEAGCLSTLGQVQPETEGAQAHPDGPQAGCRRPGIYSCESLHDRTQPSSLWSVMYTARKVTSIRVKDIRTTERETASFEVVLSHADVPGSWLRNGVQLKPPNTGASAPKVTSTA